MTDKQRMSLVLSSGGARGMVHIGAIQCLEACGYDICCISGSSIGALVGGIHARGKLDVYAQWVRKLTRNDVVRLLDIGWGLSGGLFKGERIIDELKEMIGDARIEDLPARFTAVATDINRKREVWIDNGSLFEAIRASIAIPMMFTPVRRGQQLLIDGGVLNPLPIAPTLSDDTGLTVAVDVNGVEQRSLNRGITNSELNHPQLEANVATATEPSIRETIVEFVESLLPNNGEKPSRDQEPGMFTVAMEAMDAMQVTISRLKSSVYTPDLLLQVPRDVAHFFEFERAGELIDLGYELMERELTAPEYR